MTAEVENSAGEEPKVALASDAFPIPTKEEQAKKATPFSQWKAPAVDIPSLPNDVPFTDENVRRGLEGWAQRLAEEGRDSLGQSFVELGIDRSPEALEAQRRERLRRFNERHAKYAHVSFEDSWKIATDPSWVEPNGTALSDFGIYRPPFSRLLDATLDFFHSRHHAFDNRKLRFTWNGLRIALGLKSDYAGLHWPGSGEDAMTYTMTHQATRQASTEQRKQAEEGAIGEVCPLLRIPETAIRGMLAMARREAEAVWDIEPALALTDILAAFMAFVRHHDVLPDEYIAPSFARAATLAKDGRRLLLQSKQLEDEIERRTSLNRPAWALLSGSYLNRGTAGEATIEPVDEATGQDAEDGGWEILDKQIEANITPAEAVLAPLVAPLPVSTLKLINYLPFNRRRITSVCPPTPTPGPAFKSTFLCLTTVPAPWTPEERWREMGWKTRMDEERKAADQNDAGAPAPEEEVKFELEESTIAEPETLDVWVDPKAMGLDEGDDGSWMVGMGIRARWAEVGNGEENWWILKLKDYILPACWQSTEADRLAGKDDPLPPWANAESGDKPADKPADNKPESKVEK